MAREPLEEWNDEDVGESGEGISGTVINEGEIGEGKVEDGEVKCGGEYFVMVDFYTFSEGNMRLKKGLRSNSLED